MFFKNSSAAASSNNVQQKYVLLFCAVLAFFVLSLTSKSSYLYPFNDWVDVQCFFTVGKGMMQGLVPYLDLAEQKGPYVYLLYGLASMISSTTLIGGFVLEVITGTLFLYISYRIISLYCVRFAFVGVAALAVLGFSGAMFCQGGSVEELSMAIWAYALYSVLRLLRQEENSFRLLSYANGFLMGVLFFAKYTLVGIYIGIALAIFIQYALQKKYQQIAGIYVRVFVGFLLAVLPWLIYLGANQALPAFWEWYFYNNIFVYTSDVSAWARVIATITQIFYICFKSGCYSIFFVLALVGLAWHTAVYKNVVETLLLLMIMASGFCGVYVGGKFIAYYGLILVPLVVPGIAMLLRCLSKQVPAMPKCAIWQRISIFCLIPLAVCFATLRCDNLYLISCDANTLPQMQFAEIIQQSENPTLLNYGFLDGGFYTAADVLPAEPYFCVLNVLPEAMTAEQIRYIEAHAIEFVVLRVEIDTSAEGWFVYLGYNLVKECDFYFEGEMVRYQLYQSTQY